MEINSTSAVTESLAPGIWVAVPRQPKQARCRHNFAHTEPKRTFYWIIESSGHICQDCMNVRETRKALDEGKLAGIASNGGNPNSPGKSGKVSRSTKAPVVIGAVLAKRANGANKAEIARDLRISHNTVDKILSETEFDSQIALGRSQAIGLIPEALSGAKMAFAKGDGATSCRFLEGVGVLGEKAQGRHHPDSVRAQQAINILIKAGPSDNPLSGSLAGTLPKMLPDNPPEPITAKPR